ncbi:hypothetical protein V8B97DRAFT_1859026, partial [Scleroderma yunnanense]
MAPVSTQPIPSAMPAQFGDVYYDEEKHTQQCERHFVNTSSCGCSQPRSHHACHKARLRKMLGPIVLVVLALVGILLVWCMSDMDILEAIFAGDGNPLQALGKRQSSSSFTQNKLYLIIIFVGLLLVVIAAIMLSFWCCKGAFQNPLCCPCYLCACLGGL